MSYETPECAPKLPDEVDLMNPRSPEWKRVRWSPADLDRCEHGRHSIDHCFDCDKPTNRFLMAPSTIPVEERVRHHDRVWEVRIGTMVRGEPIWVVVRDKPGEASVTEQNELPCSECGHQVKPGLHSLAECAKNQQDDAAAATVASIENPEEQTDDE